MINMTFMVRVRPEKRAEFLQVIRSLRGAGENHSVLSGVRSALYRDVDDEARFTLTCEWQTPERLEAYLRAEEFRVLFGAVKVLCETSEIKYSRTMEHFPMLRLAP
mgnify:CR=1 FL=1